MVVVYYKYGDSMTSVSRSRLRSYARKVIEITVFSVVMMASSNVTWVYIDC